VIRWIFALAPLVCAAQTIQMEGGAFRVEGWQPGPEPPNGWSSVLAVYAGVGDVPPVVGAYSVENGALVFHPKYPLTAGMHVRAVFGSKETAFDIPKAAPLVPTTRVLHIYPTTNVLPENQLKFYVYFSAPMQNGDAWSHIHLLDAAGKAVELPFLEIDQELWNPEHTRLTVLFDPGRIKRGVLPLVEVVSSLLTSDATTNAVRDPPAERAKDTSLRAITPDAAKSDAVEPKRDAQVAAMGAEAGTQAGQPPNKEQRMMKGTR
jgi:hypothetical protein